jgi:hypothetical protein
MLYGDMLQQSSKFSEKSCDRGSSTVTVCVLREVRNLLASRHKKDPQDLSIGRQSSI